MCSAAESSAKKESLKLAVAVSLLRSKIHNRLPSQSDLLRWKQKAKERKQEIIRLRHDLRQAENASHCDFIPQAASCKCYFFDNLGDASELRFDDLLRRRFFRIARTKDARKTTASSQRLHLSETRYEDEGERLRISVDFLVELCEADPLGSSNFGNWSHQAVDFILASVKNLLAAAKNPESVEESITYLITKLIIRICSPSKANEGNQPEISSKFYVQHLVRKLGREAYIGQRAIFAVSERICVLAESLLFMDPFDECFPEMDECMFALIQLIEFLIRDYLVQWLEEEAFETAVLEEWILSVVQARKAVVAMEDRNGLYVLYMDRVIGEVAKRVNSSILDKILASPYENSS